MTLSLIRFLNIIFAALLAGSSFGISLGFNPAGFSASAYTELQQHLVRSLNILMISLVVIATITTLVSAFLQRKNKAAFVLLLLAAVFFISCMVITRFGNVPIQAEMLKWTTESLPHNWTVLRDKWWSFHNMRTVAELIALALIAWTMTRPGTTEIKQNGT